MATVLMTARACSTMPRRSEVMVGQTLPGRLDLQGTLQKDLYMLTLHDFAPFTDFLTQQASSQRGEHKVAGGEVLRTPGRGSLSFPLRPQRGRTNRCCGTPMGCENLFWGSSGGSASTPHPRLPCASPLGTFRCPKPLAGTPAKPHFYLICQTKQPQ